MVTVEAQRQGVDGEIAAMQVKFDAAALDGGQSGGISIEFCPGRHQVHRLQAGGGGQA